MSTIPARDAFVGRIAPALPWRYAGVAMKVPRADSALVGRAKVRDYLLARAHPSGGAKALFFARYGFRASEWWRLAESLRAHVAEHESERQVVSRYGVKYIVRGPLRSPGGGSIQVVSVWIVRRRDERPRFVTAVPGGTR